MVEEKSHRKGLLFFSLIVGIVIFLDQLTKFFVLSYNPSVNLKLFQIHLIKNTGAGFGILQGQTILLAFISFIVMVGIIVGYKKIPKNKLAQYSFAIFLGGVIGNLIDRAFRSFVVDFIDFRFWPAFNIADMAITTASVGIIIYFWKEDKKM